MTRELQADVIAKVADLPEPAGPFNSHLSLGYKPVAGHIVYSLDPEWIVLDDSWAATESTYVQFQGRTAFGERSRDAVPRHQPRLAGKRPRARRHHDDVRRADGRGADRRQRRVRRPDARVVLEAAHRGDIQGRSPSRVGRRLGPGHRGRRDREQLRDRGECDPDVRASRRFAPMASSPSAIRARIRERRSTRASGSIAGRSPIFVTRSSWTNIRWRAWCRATSTCTAAYERPFGFGKMAIDQGVAYGETFERATSSLRFEGNGVRLDSLEITEEHRHGHRRRVRRLGGGLLLQRGRRADSGRVAQDRRVPAGAAVWPSAVQRQRRRHVRGAALRREAARRRPVRRR